MISITRLSFFVILVAGCSTAIVAQQAATNSRVVARQSENMVCLPTFDFGHEIQDPTSVFDQFALIKKSFGIEEQDQQQTPKTDPSTGQQTQQPNTQQRVIDIPKDPPKDSGNNKSGMSSKIDRTLTKFEDSKVLERVRAIFGNPYIHPLFGGLGDGSGFGGGVEVATGAKESNFRLFSSIHITLNRYMLATAGLTSDPTGGERKRYQFDVIGRYQVRPEEDFYGSGHDSLRRNRTTFNLQERGATAAFSIRPAKPLRFGVGLDYSSNRVFGGKDDRFPQTQTLFPNLPGFARGAELIGPQAFIELDTRDQPGKPRSGAFITLVGTSYDGIGTDDFGFHHLRLDARGYIPLGTKRRVLALRMLGILNDPKGGSQIPFFRLANIGNTQILRGYDSLRFWGRNALAGSVEYRYELIPGIGALLFTDFGQVFNRRSDLRWDNTEATYGGGIEFSSKKATLFRVLIAKSSERLRVIIGFNPTF